LLKCKNFAWTEEAQKAFEQLKTLLTNALVLSLLNFDKAFEVECDASFIRIGVVLSQEKKLIVYFSEKLDGLRANYSVYDVEFYVIVQALQHWRHYLLPKEFLLFIDRQALKFLHNQNKLSTRHVKWFIML
jgi:RNase H-like domain found in reverse transcriptase